MEIYKVYMDIHFMLKGEGLFGFSTEFNKKTEYDEAEDIVWRTGVDEVLNRMWEGDFKVLWPNEAHRPLINIKESSTEVRKIICKI